MKRLNILLLIITVLLIAGYFLIRAYLHVNDHGKNEDAKSPDASLDLRPLFIAKIQQLVKDGSKGLYSISIDSMDVDVLQSRVTLWMYNSCTTIKY